jgi:hypothetical protein
MTMKHSGLLILFVAFAGWLTLPVALAQDSQPSQEQVADDAIPDEFAQLLEESKQADVAPEPSLVESIERVPEPVITPESTAESVSASELIDEASTQEPPAETVADPTGGTPQVEALEAANPMSDIAILVLVAAVFLAGLIGLRFSHQIGWDPIVFVPSFFITNVPWIFVATENANAFAFLLALYAVFASGVASVWFRNRIMGWYANSTWMTIGTGAVDVLKTNIGRRYGIEVFVGVLSALFGWCGGFLLGLREINAGRELHDETVDGQVGIVA